MSRKVEAEIQAQIDKMRKEYMTHAQYVNELLERIDCLKRVNDEQAAVLTACQDAFMAQGIELRLQVERLGDRNLELQEDNERLGKVISRYFKDRKDG